MRNEINSFVMVDQVTIQDFGPAAERFFEKVLNQSSFAGGKGKGKNQSWYGENDYGAGTGRSAAENAKNRRQQVDSAKRDVYLKSMTNHLKNINDISKKNTISNVEGILKDNSRITAEAIQKHTGFKDIERFVKRNQDKLDKARGKGTDKERGFDKKEQKIYDVLNSLKIGGSLEVRDAKGNVDKTLAKSFKDALGVDIGKLLEDNNKILNEGGDAQAMSRAMLERNTQLMNDAMSSISNDQYYSQERLDKLPDTFKAAFEKSGSQWTRENAKNIVDYDSLIDTMSQLRQEYKKQAAIARKLDAKEKTIGLSSVDKKEQEKNTEELRKLTNAIGVYNDTAEKVASGGGKGGGLLGKMKGFFEGIKKSKAGSMVGKMKAGLPGMIASLAASAIKSIHGMAQKFGDEIAVQMKYGFSLDGHILDSISKLGMNAKEAAQFFGENKDVMIARNLGEKQYTELVKENAKEMLQFTGSLKEGAKFTAQNIRFARMMGDATIDTESAMNTQEKLFTQNFRKLGLTADQFDALRNTIYQAEGNMIQLGSLQEDQREEYVLGIQQQHEYYKTLGFSIQQTQKAAEVMADFSSKSPLERMKSGAKIGAMMGMVGMGGSGDQFMKNMQNFRNLSVDEQKKMAIQMTEMSDRFYASFGEQGGLIFEQLMHDQGLTGLMSTLESRTKEGLAADGDAAAEAQTAHDESIGKFTEMVGVLNSIQAATETSAAMLGMGAIQSFAKGNITEGLAGLASAFPGMGKLLGGGVLGGMEMFMSQKTAPELIKEKKEERKIAAIKLGKGMQPHIGRMALQYKREQTGEITPEQRVKFNDAYTKQMHETFEKEKHEIVKLNDSIEALTNQQKEALKLQKQEVNAATQTADNTKGTKKELEEQNRSKVDANKMWTMKLARAPGTR